MRREGMTIKEATQDWVREFNAIPTGMIEKLMKNDPDEWTELTAPMRHGRVYVYEVPGDENYGEVVSYDEESELYCVELDDGKKVSVSREDMEICFDGLLPMWGTMWQFGDSADDYWLEDLDGIRLMSMCGFRIYEHEEFGYFFGIDGCGYVFYADHWIPLYKARGLQWHDPAAEAVEYMVNRGRQKTSSGNYHFDFDEIEKMAGESVGDEFKSRVEKIANEKYGYMIADLTIENDFDFMFFTCFCPNAKQEESQ